MKELTKKFIGFNEKVQGLILWVIIILGVLSAFKIGLVLSFFPFALFLYLMYLKAHKEGIIGGLGFVSIIYIVYYFIYKGSHKHEITGIENVIIFIAFVFLSGAIIWAKLFYENDKSDILNKKNIHKTDNITSFPNEQEQESGYSFSTIKSIKDFSKPGITINNFSFYPSMEKYVKNKTLLEEAKETTIDVPLLNFTKTFMVLGAMGSGKTEFFHSILNQDGFKRKIIHDIKGDFVEKWYDPKKDFIFNPYDTRGLNWDIWEELKENTALFESFIGNLMESQAEEKDFFTSSAKRLIIDFFMKVNYTKGDATSEEKWKYLNVEIENYKKEGKDDKTKNSIYQTMELVIELFIYMAWHSKQNKKSFTIKDFLRGDGTLFLLNNSSVSTKLTPLFTGFISLFTEILLSQSDTKENLTLILLDEYISMQFEKQTRLKLLTQVRSKGGCLMLGLQYLPKHDKEHQQLLDSSSYGKLIFKLNDNETVSHIIESMGEITYVSSSKSDTSSTNNSGGIPSGGSIGKSTSYSEKNKRLLSAEHLQSMPEYSHLSIFPSSKILYLGYTQQVNLIVKNKNFDMLNQDDYYKSKYGQDNKTEGLQQLEEEIKQLEEDINFDKNKKLN